MSLISAGSISLDSTFKYSKFSDISVRIKVTFSISITQRYFLEMGF
jgi:hypothetical protein